MSTNPLPALTDAVYVKLKESIRMQGVLEPITVSAGPACFGEVGDGHHRLRACEELGVECPRQERPFDSEAAFRVFQITVNLERRQLTDVQKAEMGMALEPWERQLAEQRKAEGLRRGDVPAPAEARGGQPATTGEKTRERIGETVGLSGRTYNRIANVLKSDEEDLKEALRSGEMKPTTADEELRHRRGIQVVAPPARRNGNHDARPSDAMANVDKNQLKQIDHTINRLTDLAGALTMHRLNHSLSDHITPEDAAQRAAELAKVISPLRRLHNLLKERATQ